MSLFEVLVAKCATIRPEKIPAGRNEEYPREEN